MGANWDEHDHPAAMATEATACQSPVPLRTPLQCCRNEVGTTGVVDWRSPARVLRAATGWIEDSLQSADDDDHAVFVALIEGRLVGVVTLSESRHFTSDLDSYIGELVTAEGYEGQGVGRALLGAAEDWSRQRGLACVTLETGAQNLRALSFYRQSGYAEEGIRLTKVLSPNSACDR